MAFLDKLTDFVFDERKKISSKAAIIILSLLGVLFVDNLMGFSYNYSLDKKVASVKNLNSIISDSVSDTATIRSAKLLRKMAIERKNVIENINDYFKGFSNQKKIYTTRPNHTEKVVKTVSPNNFWFHLTSSGTFYFFGILMFPLMLALDKSSSFSQRIVMGILLTIMFCGIGLFFYWICSLIPMILDDSWVINYLINLGLQIFVICLLFKFNKTQ